MNTSVQAIYSAFKYAEFMQRLDRGRQVLKENNLPACLLMAPEHLYYFGGYDSWVSVNSPQVLIFTCENDKPTLIVRDVDLPLALETTWVEDIRTYNLVTDSFSERVAEILIQKKVKASQIAVELGSYAVPAALGDALRQAIAPSELVDATELLGNLRHRKSEAEMAYMKQAANYANLGLAAMVNKLVEGTSEIKLAAEIESAMRLAGSDYWAIPTELSSGTRSAAGHATPRARVIENGDLVHGEFAGVSHRYHATAMQTVSCGEPPPRSRELYDIALESLEAGIRAIVPGVQVADVEEASLVPLRAHGLEAAAMMRFGYGVGIAYPPIWLETLQIARGFEFTLQPGMVFVLHSCLELPGEQLGVIQGGTWAMEEQGISLLAGAGACPLLVS